MPQSTPMLALLVAAIVAGFVMVLVLTSLAAKKRREALAAKAVEMGLQFAADAPDFLAGMAPFKLFTRGGSYSRKARNVMTGRQSGCEVCLADYAYTVSSGKSSSTHRQTVCILKSPGLALPQSFLRREMALLDPLGQMLGGQDIDFDEDQDFSRAFVLQGVDPEATRRLFSAAVRVHLLRWKTKSVQLEVAGDTLMLQYSDLVKPDALRDLLQDAMETLNLLRSGLR